MLNVAQNKQVALDKQQVLYILWVIFLLPSVINCIDNKDLMERIGKQGLKHLGQVNVNRSKSLCDLEAVVTRPAEFIHIEQLMALNLKVLGDRL